MSIHSDQPAGNGAVAGRGGNMVRARPRSYGVHIPAICCSIRFDIPISNTSLCFQKKEPPFRLTQEKRPI
ncbi:hypothetical protein OXX80_006906 [Metschnikowia pulcherrima]